MAKWKKLFKPECIEIQRKDERRKKPFHSESAKHVGIKKRWKIHKALCIVGKL